MFQLAKMKIKGAIHVFLSEKIRITESSAISKESYF